MRKMLFEYAILHHKKDKDGNVESSMVIAPTTILATSEPAVGTLAARQIPDGIIDDLDNVEILIKAF